MDGSHHLKSVACITLQFCSFKCELIDLPDISLLLVNDVSTDEGVGPANGSGGPLFDLVEEVGVRGKAALGREWAGTRPPDALLLTYAPVWPTLITSV